MGYIFNPFTGTFDNIGSGGGVSIGDTIGNSPTANGLLYSDGGVVANDLITIQEDSFFGGLVTAKSFDATSYANFPTLGWVDATGFGQPGAVGVLTPGVDAQFYFMIDTSTLSAKAALNYDPGTPANSYFAVAMANGLSGTPELYLTTSAADLYVPLDMNSNPITAVDDPTNAQDASTKAYTDAKVSDTAYGSGWDGVTGIAPSKNAVYDKIESLGGGTPPGGANKDIQYNNSGAFAGDGILTYEASINEIHILNTGVQGGLLIDAVSKNSYVAVGPQGDYGPAFAQNEPHVAINTVRMIGNGGGSLSLRTNTNANTVTFFTAYMAAANYVTPSNGIVGFYLTENGANNAATITAGPTDQGFFARKARLQAQCETGLITVDATINTIQAKAQTSQTGNLFDAVDTSGTRLWGVDQNGGMKPASMADSTAANDTVYYSTDASKLVYKDSGGSVNNLY